MRKLLAAIGLLFLLLPGPAKADEGWVINNYEANFAISKEGLLYVTEAINVDFGLQQKHGIYRDLPYAYQSKDGVSYTEIKNIEVDQDDADAEVKIERNSANLRIRIGDPDRTISGVHRYVIKYRVVGALKSYENFDELYWNVTGNGWDVPVQKAVARVQLSEKPIQNACYQGVAGSTETCEYQVNQVVSLRAGDPELWTATFSSRRLGPGEGMTIATGFRKGLVPILVGQKPPSLLEYLARPASIGLFALTFLIGAVAVLRRWFRGGRDMWWAKRSQVAESMPEALKPLGARTMVVAEYEPPEGLRPAEIGVLIDERADTRDIVASIVDLATRGYIKITEIPKKGWFGSTDYQLDQVKTTGTELRPYEQRLLAELFASGSSTKTSSLKNTFYSELAEIKKLLYKEVTTRKLFAKNPESVRTKNLVIGAVISSAGVALAVLAGQNFINQPNLAYLVSVGVGVALSGMLWVAFSRAMPARTAYGHEMYLRAKGYELFINTAEKYRQRFHENENYFTQILPYAILFGATKKLAQAMKEMGVTPPSTAGWYAGAHAFDIGQFGDSMSGFEKSLSTAMASSPSSSGSGGGGFSGGGGGGGGGGGW